MRGQSILVVVMWAGGISLTTLGIASSLIAPKINAQDERILNHEARITGVEVKVERLPVLEAKIDRLLEDRGINPEKIGR